MTTRPHALNSALVCIYISGERDTYLEEERLKLATVHTSLLVDDREDDVVSGHTVVGQALVVVADEPDKHVGQCVLWLCGGVTELGQQGRRGLEFLLYVAFVHGSLNRSRHRANVVLENMVDKRYKYIVHIQFSSSVL